MERRTEGDALVELDVFADGGGFADDDAGAVVDEEIVADGGAGVDVDAGEVVGVLGHDARDERHLGFVEFVGDAVDADGEKAGVGEDDFIGVGGGGVAVKSGLDVGCEGRARIAGIVPRNSWTIAFGGGVATGAFGAAACGLVADGGVDLLVEFFVDGRRSTRRHGTSSVRGGKILTPEIAGEEELTDLPDDFDDGIAVGEMARIDVARFRLA